MKVQRDGRSVNVDITADGEGLVSHAGSALLSQLADKSELTKTLSRGLSSLRERRGGHDPGRVVRDLAVMLADGGDWLCDLRAVRDQAPLFGEVASDSTAYRAIEQIASDPALVDALRSARAEARKHAWRLGVGPERVTIDLDATLVQSHSEKEGAAGNFKGGFGFHPLLAYFDETSEAAAAILRPGNAGANTAADQIAVAEAALEQIPADRIEGIEVLLRVDSAGASHELLDWAREGRGFGFAVGFDLPEAVREAICALPERAWSAALDQDGQERENGQVAEITQRLDLSRWPKGSRVIVPPRAAPPRRPALLHRLRRPPLPGDPHRSARGRHRADRAPPPRQRAGRGPDPPRQGHRPGEAALSRVRAERGLAGTRLDRPRFDRLDPEAAALRRACALREEQKRQLPLPPSTRSGSKQALMELAGLLSNPGFISRLGLLSRPKESK